tara:strand:- start:69 stop:350 length:282 start_codon:yes stop_codon:yes gene_type:complete
MPALVLFDCPSTSAATDHKAEADAGSLWGVDLGTTTKTACYADRFLVEATPTRLQKLVKAMPVEMAWEYTEAAPFTSAGSGGQMWFLRGMLEA